MAPPLTIRNLTSTPIELKLVERHEVTPEPFGASIAGITKNLTALMTNSTSPAAPLLAADAQGFSHQDVSVPIAPYEIKVTDIATTERGPDEVMRLTFETEGERYSVDTAKSSRSTTSKPLTPHSRFEYTSIYLPEFSYLALFSSAHLSSWMGHMKNETPLSRLSIPGTHNSPTCHLALPSVRCQAVSPKEQLENGVRFFDIRVQPEFPEEPSKDALILVHSAFPISLTGSKYFRDLLNVITSFLDANPTETLIMSLKREGTGTSTDQQLSKIFHDHYANDPKRWFTENRIPTLGEVRGKIVMIRRFSLDDSLNGEHSGTGWCIDAQSWPDNCEDGVCSSGELRVQDFYEVEETVNIDKKIKFSHAHLDRAAKSVWDAAAKNPFFINFLSASNFFRPGCWPDRVAAKVNPSVVSYLCRMHNEDGAGDGSTGVVVCDWVGESGDWDLVRCVVGHNARLEMQ